MSNPFQIVGAQTINESPEDKALDLKNRLEKLIHSAPIVLFMKGTPQMPQCGFSANVCKILQQLGVSYQSFNILSDMEIREGLKQYSNWPTYPQLYVKGQLLGGNDVITEMQSLGELEAALKV